MVLKPVEIQEKTYLLLLKLCTCLMRHSTAKEVSMVQVVQVFRMDGHFGKSHGFSMSVMVACQRQVGIQENHGVMDLEAGSCCNLCRI